MKWVWFKLCEYYTRIDGGDYSGGEDAEDFDDMQVLTRGKLFQLVQRWEASWFC